MSGFGFPSRTPAGLTVQGIPVDALVAGPSAASNGAPLLFVATDSVPGPIKTYLVANPSIGKIVVVGGTAAVSQAVRDELLKLISGT